jgi:HlyD family secretion protein
MKRRILVPSFLIVSIAGAVWALSSRNLPLWLGLNPGGDVEPILFQVKRAPFRIEVPAFGELQTASSTSISVPQVRIGGLKVFWIVRNGTLVKKGETLVEFDASELIQQARETKSNLDATLRQLEVTVLRGGSETGGIIIDRDIAGMELDKARTQAPRDRDIFTRNEIIEGELNIGLSNTKVQELGGKADSKGKINETSQKILVIERRQHETRRDMLEQGLGSLKILAPHDGLVLHVKDDWDKSQGTSVGDMRWPGDTILTIPDISAMKAKVYVLESDAGNLKEGQSGYVVVDSNPDQRFPASVERLETLARALEKESPVKYFEVVLKLDARGSSVLRPGKLVRASITVAELESALTVPRSAVVEENRKFFVWVQHPVAPEKRDVEIGSGDTARVVIRSGVQDGERVLLNPPRETSPR